MHWLQRRIGRIACAVGALAVAGVLGAGAVEPGSAPAAQTQASPIHHIVVLDMENHSFDNVLGYWCQDRPGRCHQSGMPRAVTFSNAAVVTPGTDPDVVPIVRHMVKDQVHAINGGKMNGWLRIPGCRAPPYWCVSGYKPRQIPNVSALATRFAISDRTFSMADSPSWGGHLDIVTSNLDGFTGDIPRGKPPGVPQGRGWGCDSGRQGPWHSPGGGLKQEPSCVPDPSLTVPNGGAFRPSPVRYEPTIMDELAAAGKSWRIYGARCTHEKVAPDGLMTCAADQSGYNWAICPSLAECLYTQGGDVVPSAQFTTDARAGDLPAFSVVIPTGADSQHNGFSMTAGDDWLGQVASAVMHGPQWHSTVLFITWDDCGCFYDQVLPGINPDGTRQGPRVPLVIVSPYAKRHYTDTKATTFAGILAYTEHTFGLPALGVNDAAAYPYTNAFDYSQKPLKPVHMVTRPIPRGDHIIWSQANEDS